MKWRWVTWIMPGMIWTGLQAQDPAIVTDTGVLAFDLAEVQVIAKKSNPFTAMIGGDKITGIYRTDVSQTLELLTGVNYIHVGPRNEGMVTVRGFDLRQVPVYVDGVPVYVSYDGYTDLARFLVSDLAQVSVSRGETSLLIGPNALGGAINLVTRRPGSPFEMDASTGMTLDRSGWGGWQADINLGGRSERFYFQGGLGYLDREPFVLSRKVDSGTEREPVEQENSQQKDLKFSVKAGFTPNSTDSYVISYHHQEGSKGVPPYSGKDPNQRPRFWQFPEVKKQGIHFNSKTGLGREGILQVRLFYDDYYSDLRSYDDSTYTSMQFRSSFTSIYHDETLGGSAFVSFRPASSHELKAAVHTGYDHHREYNTHPVDEAVRHFRDLTFSAGMEDHIAAGERLDLEMGVGFDSRNNLQADNYEPSADSIFPFPGQRDVALNLRAGMLYRAGEKSSFSVNLSRKNRFPTMKDRYSYRLGRSVPNPGLQAESSWNTDLGYALSASSFRLKSALFFSSLQNTIQAVYGVDPENSAVYQFRNTGRAVFYGWEAEVSWNPVENLETGIQYTLTERRNLSEPEIGFTDVPRHKLRAEVDYLLFSRLRIGWNGTCNSSRISTSDGRYRTDPFFINNVSATFRVLDGFRVEASVKNLLDVSYSYVEGYPAPGRQFFLGLRYSFR